MIDTPKDPGEIWSKLLSRRPEVIRQTFAALDAQAQEKALEHLERMAHEDGWQPQQKYAALAALEALRNVTHQG